MSDEGKSGDTLAGVIVEQKIKEFLKNINPKFEELENKIETETTRAKDSAVQEIGFSLSQMQKQITGLVDENKKLKEELEDLKSSLEEKDKILKEQNEKMGKIDSDLESLSSAAGKTAEQIILTSEKFSEDIDKASSEIDAKISKIKNELDALSEKTDSEIVSVKKQIDASVEKTGAILTNVMNEMESSAKKTAANLEKITNDVNEQFQQVADTLKQHFEENAANHAKIQDQFNEQGETIKQLEELINSIREHITKLREETLKSFTEVKADKKDLMQRFQRIVMGTAETLRNENIIVAKEVRNQLDAINKDFSSSYYSVEDGRMMEEQTRRLGEELKENSEKIRDKLVENIDDAIKQFQVATKEAIGEVNELKLDIERYRDEILSLIERKVNEKYDFVFDILSNLLTKSEELKIIVRDGNLKTP
ncbi:MAG: hypothetical protein ACTSRU_02210 [Candidatus Hodarchaeales archaeon]